MTRQKATIKQLTSPADLGMLAPLAPQRELPHFCAGISVELMALENEQELARLAKSSVSRVSTGTVSDRSLSLRS